MRGNLDESIGISLTGALYHNSLTSKNIDTVHPIIYNGFSDTDNYKEQIDYNLVHPDDRNGIFHYHMVTPAIAKTPLEKTRPVSVFQGSLEDEIIKYFQVSEYARQMKPVGLAKDGHIIWGPYTVDGNEKRLW
jgi:hypothetical protein